MPSARKMLDLVAKDPVARARLFILAMRLFLEHVLGTGPVDDLLRHNGWLDGAAWPDGFAPITAQAPWRDRADQHHQLGILEGRCHLAAVTPDRTLRPLDGPRLAAGPVA